MTSETKVLHIIARMNVGGTAKYVGELVKSMPNNYLATGFVQGSEIEDPITEKLDIYRVKHLGRSLSPINDFKAWIELRKIISEIKPEIVHTHTFKAGLIGRLVAGKFKRVHTFHGHLFDEPSLSYMSKYLIKTIERILAFNTDTFISVGEKVGKELRSKGIGRKKVWTSIPPGVSIQKKYNKRLARNTLGLSENNLTIGWLARMTEVKNPELLLKIANRMPNVTFAMGGGGDLFEKIRNEKLSNVEVLGWVDSAYFWSAVDLAISTSKNEGMSVSLIEAQLFGIPVVATDVGSTSEIIQNGVTGILVPDQNVHNFVAGIEFLSNKLDSNYSRIIEDFSKKFSTNKFHKSHSDLYVGLLTETH